MSLIQSKEGFAHISNTVTHSQCSGARFNWRLISPSIIFSFLIYFLQRRSKCHDKNNHFICHPCSCADQNKILQTAFLSTYEFKSILTRAQKHIENKALLWQERLWKCKVASTAVRLLLLIEETPNRRGGAQGKSQLKVSCLMKDIPAKRFTFSTPCRFYRKLRRFRLIFLRKDISNKNGQMGLLVIVHCKNEYALSNQ